MKKMYKNMSYLIGQEVEYKSGLHIETRPEKVEVLNEYERTILLEMTFPRVGGVWKIRRMVSKAAMFCGDIRIVWNGITLTGREIKNQTDVRDIPVNLEAIML